MTVIAFRDGVLAADTLITGDSCRAGYSTKIVKNGALAAAAGNLACMNAFLDWARRGYTGYPPPMKDRAEGFLVHDGWILSWTESGWDRLVAPFYAIGCGAKAALGAMAAGASAEEAVKAACLVDVACGGPIDILTVR